MKKLNLKKETLADLTAEDLAVIAGAQGAEAASANLAITYRCVFPTGGCVIQISNTCFQYFTNGCTGC